MGMKFFILGFIRSLKKNALKKKDGFKGAMILYRGMTCVTHSVYFLSSDTLVDLYFFVVLRLQIRTPIIFEGNKYPLSMSCM